MNKTETPTNIDVTPREAAIHLLANPKAKLSNKARKACRTMLDMSAVSSQEAALVIGHYRAARRRFAKDVARPDVPQSKPRKDGEAKLEAKLARKSAAQIGKIIWRGLSREKYLADKVAKAASPKHAMVFAQMSVAYRRTADRATAHYHNRVNPKATCTVSK